MSHRTKARHWLSAAVAAVGLVLVFLVAPKPAPAQAANITDGFEPGFIISDNLFYNGNDMSASQVQSFLNQRVPRCTIGDQDRRPGDPAWWGGPTVFADFCLRNHKMDTVSRPADAYCKAYSGKRNESAAEIIVKVAQACGISPRVILIMLEKEQSLVTDEWPTIKQFNIAMGYACPDTGPGNSANCDANYFGFFNQVYWGTRQLKVYRSNPHLFNYKPGMNTILWHPNESCGTSQVNIENWATASLYIYTPYRPNQAALRAGWGTGDACSSYGNRNFYNFYKAWFGQPNHRFPIASELESYWQLHGSRWLGNPSATEVRSGAGVYQSFDGGKVFASAGGVAIGMTNGSALLNSYERAGMVTGPWGWPQREYLNIPGLGSGNGTMQFQHGLAVERNSSSLGFIPNRFVSAWNESGGVHGAWGWPTSIGKCDSAGETCQVDFTNGTAVYSNVRGIQFTPFKPVSPVKPDPSNSGNLVGGAV